MYEAFGSPMSILLPLFHLYQISTARTNEEIRLICEDAADALAECGFTKPPILVGLQDKPTLVKAVCFHHLILKCKGELDQLKDGLGTLGVADAMKLNPSIFEPLFTATSGLTELTPGTAYI